MNEVDSLCLLLLFFHTSLLAIGETNTKYRTELTFRYLIVGIRYFRHF